ncbi:MAG: hypothetical protein BWX67_02130 [Thermotogae bacterium ADurb.Bin062]|nr:MAG: hypothetical protein BWX67_02130 [Thermotogota bacterium ADurb.Bin062]
MTDDKKIIKGYSMTQKDGSSWSFTPEAGEVLGGIPGLIVFTAAISQTVKTGTNEVSFKGYGLFNVSKHGKTIKVRLLERESK